MNQEKLLLTHLIVIPTTFFLLVLYTQTVSNDFHQYELIYNIVRGDSDWWGNDSILPGGGINLTTLIIQTRYEPGFIALYYYLSNFFSAFVPDINKRATPIPNGRTITIESGPKCIVPENIISIGIPASKAPTANIIASFPISRTLKNNT